MRDVLSEVAAADPVTSQEDLAVHDLQRAYVARASDDPQLEEWLTSALNLAGPSYLACEILKCFPGRAPEHAPLLAQQYLSALPSPGGTLAAMVHLRQTRRERSSPDAMSRLLDLAEGELDAAGRPSRWLAEYYELRGSLALDRGDGDEAGRQFQSARVLQERLGNALAVRALDDQRGGAPGWDSDFLLPTAAPAHARETCPGAGAGRAPTWNAMAAAIARAGKDNRRPAVSSLARCRPAWSRPRSPPTGPQPIRGSPAS